MDNNSFNMDERNGKKPKQDSESSLLGQMFKKTSLIMTQVADGFEPNDELRTAIKDENVAEIRNLTKSNIVPLSKAVEAIVRSDNDDLLRRFLSENGEVKVIDGALVTDEESVPAIGFSIRGLALRCATSLVQIGVRASQEECAEIMRIAFNNDDIEAMDQFLKTADRNTLTKYLFEAAEKGSAISVSFIIDKLEAAFKIDLASLTESGGDTVLHVAARSQSKWSEEVINLLLSKEPRLLEIENEQMRTPLHVAAYCKNAEICRYLILKGANVAQIDKMNEVILKTILKNTPRAMPAILQRCDAGVVLENDKIELDFRKAFGSKKGVQNQKEHDMLLLQTLSTSPFQEYVEHPLLEAFVRHKFNRVKAFFWFVTLLPTMLLAAIFSVYAVLLFGQLCQPDEIEDPDEERYDWHTDINCIPWEDNETEYSILQATWVILLIFTGYFWLREVLESAAHPRKFFTRMESYGNMAIDILLVLCLYKGFPHDDKKFERWQFHVATVTSFLLWVQTMLTLGKYPGYGKYIIMFKSVCYKMVKFFLCYAWLGIGFLVAFKIFFSDERVFEGFPIPLVTMLVWMLGELEYADKLFPEDVKLNLLKKVVELNGTNEKHYTGIEESENGYLQFAGTAHFFFAAYVILFSIIIMNLLIGLAVSDIKTLMESAKRGSIITQINLVNDMMDLRSTLIYRFCVPAFIKQLFEGILSEKEDFRILTFSFNDSKHRSMKKRLYDHCIRKEEAEKAERIQFQAERMETELRELKNLLKENVKNNSSR